MTSLTAPASEALVAHAIAPGAVIQGRWEVRAKLAEGTAAVVYRGLDRLSKREVALKVFDPLRSADPVARRRFEREFAVLSRLDHPGVARALALEQAGELDVLVLELVEGEVLKSRLARGPLGVEEARVMGRRLAEALEACHAAGVIHRDLKPSNVVLHPERGPVILDFGVAWLSSAMTLTRTGALVGSPRYMAPELLEGPDVDERADVYAVGAMLFEALTGAPARAVDTMAELAAMDAHDPPPSPRRLRREVPPDLDGAVRRALLPRPEHRFATARELASALAGATRSPVPLETRPLTCAECGGGLLVELPLCPGCGRATDWALEPGPFAVQLLEVESPAEVLRWLARRHRAALTAPSALLARRLENPPVTLVLGVSERTAEALSLQAREVGCRTEIVRARRGLGPGLRLPSASPGEILAASALHFAGVVGIGGLLALAGLPFEALALAPIPVAAVGAVAALRYATRPILSVVLARAIRPRHPFLDELGASLGRCKSARARRLAAGAVARATSLLTGDLEGVPRASIDEALEALRDALAAAALLDVHQAALVARPRARLRLELARAEAAGDAARVAALEAEREAFTALAIEHDLTARKALEATAKITAALETRALPSEC